MDGQQRLSLAEFAKDLQSAGYRNELRSSWATALLCRRPGILLAWAGARAGFKPMSITMLALVLALTMPLQAVLLPITVAPVLLMLTGLVFQILDCADGTLARATGQTSKLGGDLDFLIDMAQWGLLYLSLGLLADRLLGGAYGWALLGASAAWVRLFARVIRDQLDDGLAAEPAPLRPMDYPVALIAGLSGLIPFLALSGPFIGYAIVALMLYSVLDVIDGLLPLARRR